MIPLPTGVRVWIAAGHTDMRRGMQSLALLVQEALKRDPHAGDLYVFRGRSGSLIKILWHDGIGMSLYAMGWANSHLYEIRAGDVSWSTPYPDQDWAGDFLDARKARLGNVLEDVGAKTLKYLYDFGDGWEHTIKIECLIDPEPGTPYPRLIEAKGCCPPEDVGGPWGYAEFLEAIADPKHERHRELKEWFADDFNPHVVNVDRLSEDVAELAQSWSRQPAVKRRRSA